MANVNYLAVSFALVWLLLVGYVGFLHLRVRRLQARWERHSSSRNEEDAGGSSAPSVSD